MVVIHSYSYKHTKKKPNLTIWLDQNKKKKYLKRKAKKKSKGNKSLNRIYCNSEYTYLKKKKRKEKWKYKIHFKNNSLKVPALFSLLFFFFFFWYCITIISWWCTSTSFLPFLFFLCWRKIFERNFPVFHFNKNFSIAFFCFFSFRYIYTGSMSYVYICAYYKYDLVCIDTYYCIVFSRIELLECS